MSQRVVRERGSEKVSTIAVHCTALKTRDFLSRAIPPNRYFVQSPVMLRESEKFALTNACLHRSGLTELRNQCKLRFQVETHFDDIIIDSSSHLVKGDARLTGTPNGVTVEAATAVDALYAIHVSFRYFVTCSFMVRHLRKHGEKTRNPSRISMTCNTVRLDGALTHNPFRTIQLQNLRH